jgi:hypothetical protein
MAGKYPDKYWTKERVIASAKEYETLGEWKKTAGGARAAATKNGWYEEATAHMTKIHGSRSWKWTKEAVLADAKKYKSKSEWRKSSRAYQMAHRQGWLDEACQHMTELWQAKWDKEAVIADAKKYQSRTIWEESSSGAYASAKRNGWYEEATADMPMLIESWTKDKVLEDAKKYRTRGEWFSNSSSYSIAHINGWLDEASAHMITTYSFGELVIYTYLLEHDIEFIHQKRFANLKHINLLPFDFFLPEFNLLVEYHGIQHKRGWSGNKDNAKDIQYRDSLKEEYAKRNNIRYLMIDALGQEEIIEMLKSALSKIAAELNLHFEPIRRNLTIEEKSVIANLAKWTKEAVLASAKKFNSVTEWKKFEDGAYNKALKMGWKDEATMHMTPRIKKSGHWTKENVLESAKPFNTQIAWKDTCGGAWSKAIRMGWIAEATAHMPIDPLKKPNGYWTKERVLESAKRFSKHSEWRANEPSAVSIASKNGWIAEATAHMQGLKGPGSK